MSDAESEIDALEAEGRYAEAIEALGRLGEQSGEDVRWHIAWMHTRARDLEAARTIWDTLRAERPQDPGVPYLEGAALAEDGHFSEALGPMGEALALGLEVQSDPTLLRRVAEERLTALSEAGARPEDVDHRAREVLGRSAPAVPWFAEDQFELARGKWAAALPASDDGYAAYCAELDRSLRHGGQSAGRNPVLVAIAVDETEAFAAGKSWQPEWPVTHDQVAAHAVASEPERSVTWPPGRNDACWCGSGSKYKRCCGR